MSASQAGASQQSGQHPSASVAVFVRGTGSIGLRHLTVLRDRLGLAPVALPVRSERLRELEAGGFRTSEHLSDRNGQSPGACIVATETERHLSDAADALQSGCAVLVEKPLSFSTKGMTVVKRQSERLGLPVFLGCNLRFSEGLRTFRNLLPGLGGVHSVRIECQSYLPDWRPDSDYRRSYSAREGTGGVLLDLIHEIDYAVWLFGAPKSIFARLGNSGRLGIQSEDFADLSWITPENTAISIRLDYITRPTRRRMSAIGENGVLEWDAIAQCVRRVSTDDSEQTLHYDQERDDMYGQQAEAFLGAVAGGQPGDLATFEEGATAVALCDAARRSSLSGHAEPVRDWSSE